MGAVVVADKKRTASGAPTQKAREQHGFDDGSFPVFDHTSAMSAVSLRGHGSHSNSEVLDKVSRYANQAGDAVARAAVAKARKEDQK